MSGGQTGRSRQEAARFLEACRTDPTVLTRFEGKPLADLVLHARCDGFDFSRADLSAMIGEMEVWAIMTVAGEGIDSSSSLWRTMWGRSRLDYVVRELWTVLDDATRLHITFGSTEGVAT